MQVEGSESGAPGPYRVSCRGLVPLALGVFQVPPAVFAKDVCVRRTNINPGCSEGRIACVVIFADVFYIHMPFALVVKMLLD